MGGGGGAEGDVYFGDVQIANAVIKKQRAFVHFFSILLIIHKENTKEIDIFTSYFIIDRIGILDGTRKYDSRASIVN